MRWNKPSRNDGLARHLGQQFGISPVVASLLANRGLSDPHAVGRFLRPSLQDLADPLLPGGMREAVERLERALRLQEEILIFGDYDVDGVTSTVLLTDFLRQFGLSPRFVVPKRLEEGYGLSLDSLRRALAEYRPKLLIAVDCGTGSSHEVAWLREQGIDVLILDHHTSKESIPTDCILVNPHVHDPEDVPWKHLCSVGLVFKFCHAFLKVMREKGDPLATQTDLREYLDLVALGTVADLVLLEGENRILVKHGLERLKSCQRPGICALMEVAGITLGEEISPFDIGFKLGPRINASGRLDDATVPIQLLLNGDWTDCHRTAQMLDSYNSDRQDIERAITMEAENQVETLFADDFGMILHSADWHAGVVGIVASRIARKFNRPTLVLGTDQEGLIKGSGRSIEGVNLVEVLQACTDHILQWGGHPMAVGLTAREDRIAGLREAFNQALRAQFPEGLPEPYLNIDAVLETGDLTKGLLKDLDALAPFGQGNPEPVFALEGVHLATVSQLGKDHLRFTLLPSGQTTPIDGVAWGMAQRPMPVGEPVDLAIRFHWHSWRGRRSPRLTLLDWRR
ncbi:MAG: single-stranded-DNA-specific exonuclease RecJ, partial [Oceanipulchritudo sp.]